MTARRFPKNPSFASYAEQLFAAALLDHLPDDAVVFCGQRFSDRREDREADLIVAWPGVGIAVVEVKGGSVSLQHGEWRQSGRTRDKVIHPVDQARICKYLLRDYLDEHPRWSAGNARLGHLVALPTTTLPDDFRAPDLPRWMVVDQTDL
ncbi:nuclease-related domain-containing protein, partial [Modestobacter sp. SYSU DS0903]